MIEWAHPWAFGLLLPVLSWPLVARWTGRARLVLPSRGLVRSRITLRRLVAGLPGLLLTLGLVCWVMALARPRRTETDVVVESEGLDILLAVDTSGSMQETDLVLGRQAADRLTVAKKVLRDFIAGRPHDRLGVVAFGEDAFTFVPLTLDHGTLLEVLDSLQIGIAGANGTAVGQAIAVGAKRLKELEAPSRILILLTDGRNNAGRIQPMEAAQAAAALDIRLYTIGVGAPVGGLRRMLGGEGVDEEGLKAIAELTGGKYFRATSTAALEEIYATIDELEPSTAEVRQMVSHTELYRWWLGPGFGLVAVGWLLRSTLLRRLP